MEIGRIAFLPLVMNEECANHSFAANYEWGLGNSFSRPIMNVDSATHSIAANYGWKLGELLSCCQL
jgi:hypothetical protein